MNLIFHFIEKGIVENHKIAQSTGVVFRNAYRKFKLLFIFLIKSNDITV